MNCTKPFRPLPIVALLLLIGCSPPPIQGVAGAVPLSGTVTLDGQPLAEAQIMFIELASDSPRKYLAMVQDGKFAGEAPPGEYRVEIWAWKRPEPGENIFPYPSILPARYNDASELTVELHSDRPNELSFELQSGR